MTRIGLSMLVAYGADDVVTHTLDVMAARDDDGNVVGFIDFEGHELAGGQLTDIWVVEGAAGSKTWPEWIDARGWKIEKEGPAGSRRIAALLHPSGHRRERAPIEAEIDRRMERQTREAASLRVAMAKHLRSEGGAPDEAQELAGRIEPAPTDLRDLLGGPDRPLLLDERGRRRRQVPMMGTPKHLPLLGGRRLDEAEDSGREAEGGGAEQPLVGGPVPVAPGE